MADDRHTRKSLPADYLGVRGHFLVSICGGKEIVNIEEVVGDFGSLK